MEFAMRPNQVLDVRAAFNDDIDKNNLVPLWDRLHSLVPREPTPQVVAALWRYRDVRPHLMRAGSLVTATEAVRRVLVMENPILRGCASITQTLYAGLQLILPGEVAPSHRHTQSALRLVVEGGSATTTVAGERIPMAPGDFIITPSWTWHDHGNRPGEEGGVPVVWLDGLDIPLVGFLSAQFAEDYGKNEQPRTENDGVSLARFGSALLPARHRVTTPVSPLAHYPYARTREALDAMFRNGDLDAWDGVKLRYVNPATGGSAMPSIATCMQFLPGGFSGRHYRTTDATVFSVVEGNGTAVIGSQLFDFEPKDTFVVPSWEPLSLSASADSVLFSFSDRPLHDALGLHRELRE
jgi:gentisate 1,2-dioxygenase